LLSRPPSRHRALPVSEYRGNMALQATARHTQMLPGSGQSAGTQQLCRCPPAHTCTCVHASTRWINPFRINPFGTRRCARERRTSRAISFRPRRALTPVHGTDWHGLACGKCDTFQIYESCVERASARALRIERSSAKMAMQSGSTSRIESRVSGCERRGAGAPLTQEDLTVTVQHAFARCILLPQVAVRVEHGRNSLQCVIHNWHS
jgi:hypothetical protein